jgi:hemerythrin-like domain-containing protein
MIQIGAPSAKLDAPVEHLMACHRRIEQRLDTLVAAAGHLQNDRQQALDAIAKSIRFLDSNGVMHTEDEEESLFPRLRPKLSREEIAYVDSLEAQHRQADDVYAKLKAAVGKANGAERIPDELRSEYLDCAQRLRALYRDHIQSEDSVLTGLAKRSLTATDLEGITAEMRERRGQTKID